MLYIICLYTYCYISREDMYISYTRVCYDLLCNSRYYLCRLNYFCAFHTIFGVLTLSIQRFLLNRFTVSKYWIFISKSYWILVWVTFRATLVQKNPVQWSCFVASSSDYVPVAWCRHQMKTFFALLALCAGNSPVTGEFPSQRPVTRCFDVFFDPRQ